MGRPKTPLVDREEVVATALGIIDKDGLDALSLRRLGTELGVTGAALYHHFADKEEILRGVVELVLSREVLPRLENGGWEDYVEASVTRFRAALVAHPNSAPLMAPRGTRPPFDNLHREFIATKMLEAGVPRRLCYPIIDSTESLVFGSVMTNPRQLPLQERLGLYGRGDQPNLQKVVRATAKAADRVFQLQLRALLAGWRVLIEEG
ncbi:TetR family transcriptional regulator [Amycolatopsis acidicola]|uniref:TetR family transcriptional regulator n=1 Tax=Amycolatopsis acidicola TaxID=2596893 RepID=A0A5N0US19_9PSEU|nr:TetR family transcriptional regulator [Amycolatopsis acidicola]KAA9153467.1 TetR family transcriptional regulator [Amycolatopsis acidicola]